nr:ABC transport system substrate-binding protein [uncultured Gammaproteobacteria bacterium]
MGREAHAVLAGLFVLGLGIVALTVGLWLGNVGAEYDPYVVVSRYPVSGLRPESTVFYRGVEIGKVTRIELSPDDLNTIRVQIQIAKGFPMTDKSFARLRVQPLTGLAQIELDSREGPARRLTTRPEAPAVIPMQPSLFEQLTGTGQDLMGELQRLVLGLNELLDAENRKRIAQILANVEAASRGLVRLEAETAPALAEAPKVLASTQRTLAALEKLSGELITLSQQGQALLAKGSRLSAALHHDTLPRFHTLLEEVQAASSTLKNLSERLEQEPQAVLWGPAPPEPGPGEPGYRESRR